MTDENAYLGAYNGRLIAVRSWNDLDQFWETLRSTEGPWYAYAVGEPPPTTTLEPSNLDTLLNELDSLLRQDHDEEYCGIVYADDHKKPSFVKIYDPNNLGSACGSSGAHTFPGWTLSTAKPINLQDAIAQPGNRRRWWQKLLS